MPGLRPAGAPKRCLRVRFAADIEARAAARAVAAAARAAAAAHAAARADHTRSCQAASHGEKRASAK